MNKKEKIDEIFQKTQELINSENNNNFYVYINKTNSYINITMNYDKSTRSIGEWLEKDNDIIYGPYSYTQAIAYANIFSNLYHIYYRQSFGIKTTNGNINKAF
jgi:hypothetical protein